MGKLNNKIAIVLGAAGRENMGQHIARRFADEGAMVVVAGRHLDELMRLADEIGGAAFSCDITKRAEIEKLAVFTKQKFGQINVALNATGWGLLKPFLETIR